MIKRRDGKSQREDKSRREKNRREKEKESENKNIQVREMLGKSLYNRCVVRMICGSGGSKSRFPKAAGAEPSEID